MYNLRVVESFSRAEELTKALYKKTHIRYILSSKTATVDKQKKAVCQREDPCSGLLRTVHKSNVVIEDNEYSDDNKIAETISQ